MPIARAERVIRRPRAEVFAFHADAANLTRVVPVPIRARAPAPLSAGRDVHLALGVGPFTVHIPIGVRVWDPPRVFVDEQRYGPFRRWEHRHEFTERGHETIVRDTVAFELIAPFAWAGPVATAVVTRALAAKLGATARVLEARALRRAA